MKMEKIILLSLAIFIYSYSFGQSELFKSQWLEINKTVNSVDTLTNNAYRYNCSLGKKRAKYKCNSIDKKNKKIINVKYRKGQILSIERYYIEGKTKIKILRVNGQIVLLETKVDIGSYGFVTKSNFTFLGNNRWLFTYTTKAKEASIYKIETVENWR